MRSSWSTTDRTMERWTRSTPNFRPSSSTTARSRCLSPAPSIAAFASARYSHVCLLNNDMLAEPGFLREPARALSIGFPACSPPPRRSFSPKAAAARKPARPSCPPTRGLTDFPVRCEEPLDGEDLSYVLYGSGGCTLYDAAKLAALGGFDEVYEPRTSRIWTSACARGSAAGPACIAPARASCICIAPPPRAISREAQLRTACSNTTTSAFWPARSPMSDVPPHVARERRAA